MARRTHPRSEQSHAFVASEILLKHERRTGEPISLPVPIEAIVEVTYGLTVLHDEIEEPPGAKILGALSPVDKTIVLNSKHEALFENVVGPERFTYAHELAHWIYDADDPNQMSLALDAPAAVERFCRDVNTPGLDAASRLREVNANKLAAHLLLPEALVRAADLDAVLRDFRDTARRWGVSQECLRIRLESLDLLTNDYHVDLLWE